MVEKPCALALILVCIIAFSQLAFSDIARQTIISSQGTLSYATYFDSCENTKASNGDWFYDSRYENLTIDTQNKIEGSGSFRIDINGGSTWSAYFWKRPNAAAKWKWDMSTTPKIKFRIFPVDKIPTGGMEFELVTIENAGWNIHFYPISNLTVNNWNLVEIDLRKDEAGSDMSDALKYCGQITIIAHVNRDSFTYRLDWFESFSAPALPLEAKIIPEIPNVFANEVVTLRAVPSYGAGEPFVYSWSTGQAAQQITVQYSAIGTYGISCQVYSSNRPSEIAMANATISVVSRLPMPTQLHTSGSRILDQNNNQVFLRGVNYGSFGDTSSGGFDNASAFDGYSVFRPSVASATFKAMARNQLNCIRIMLVMDWWKKNFSGHIDISGSGGITEHSDASYPAYRNVVTQTVNLANQEGLYVVISIWTSDYTTMNRRLELPFPSNAFPDETSVTNFWLELASAFSAYPNVIFEFYNEPNTDASLSTTFDQYYTMTKQTIDQLRQGGYDVPVLCQWGYCGGFNWTPGGAVAGTTDSWLYKAVQVLGNCTNVIFSHHLYRYHGTFGTPAPSWSGLESVRNYLQNNDGYDLPQSWNLPVLIGEVGAVYGDATELETFRNALQCLNEWNMSYLAFTWSNSGLWRLCYYPMSSPVLSETGSVLVQKIVEGS